MIVLSYLEMYDEFALPSQYTARLAHKTIDNLVMQLIFYSSLASNFNSF